MDKSNLCLDYISKIVLAQYDNAAEQGVAICLSRSLRLDFHQGSQIKLLHTPGPRVKLKYNRLPSIGRGTFRARPDAILDIFFAYTLNHTK